MDYVVTVHFAVGSGPQKVFSTPNSEEAIAEARQYLSDSQGVWIDTPDGHHVRITHKVAAEW